MADFLILLLVLGGCLFAFVAIGDLFDHFFRRSDTETVHRRWRPLSRADRPAVDPREYSGGYVDDTYGKDVWSDPNYPNGPRDGWYDPNLGSGGDSGKKNKKK